MQLLQPSRSNPWRHGQHFAMICNSVSKHKSCQLLAFDSGAAQESKRQNQTTNLMSSHELMQLVPGTLRLLPALPAPELQWFSIAVFNTPIVNLRACSFGAFLFRRSGSWWIHIKNTVWVLALAISQWHFRFCNKSYSSTASTSIVCCLIRRFQCCVAKLVTISSLFVIQACVSPFLECHRVSPTQNRMLHLSI